MIDHWKKSEDELLEFLRGSGPSGLHSTLRAEVVKAYELKVLTRYARATSRATWALVAVTAALVAVTAALIWATLKAAS